MVRLLTFSSAPLIICCFLCITRTATIGLNEPVTDVDANFNTLVVVNLNLLTGQDTEYCTFTFPNGTARTISEPDGEYKDDNYLLNRFTYNPWCMMTINKMGKQFSGSYKIKAKSHNEDVTERTANIYLQVPVQPTEPNIYAGDSLTVGMDYLSLFEDIVECEAKSTSVSNTAVSSTDDGTCSGIIYNTKFEENIFRLSLKATTDNNIMYSASTTIRVQEYPMLQINTERFIGLEGASETISIGLNDTSVQIQYCRFTSPKGKEYQGTVTGACEIDINPFTKEHAGDWMIDVFIKNVQKPVQGTFEVVSLERSTRRHGTSRLVDGNLEILFRTNQKVSSCLVKGPANQTIYMTTGIGNGVYEYFHDRSYDDNFGLRIINPQNDVYGTWSCDSNYVHVVQGANDGNYSQYINKATLIFSEPYTVHAITDTILQLGCKVEAWLENCWFTKPDGTAFTPEYNAENLRRGICIGSPGKVLNGPDRDDNGEWQCHLQVVERHHDIVVPITVIVADTFMVATEKKIVSDDGSALLMCQMYPDTYRAMQYCRFVRPDGVGINLKPGTTEGKYSAHGDLSLGECGLKIAGTNSEDSGTWTCAGLHLISSLSTSDKILEQHDTIDLDLGGLGVGAIVGIVIGSIAGAVILVGGIVYMATKKK